MMAVHGEKERDILMGTPLFTGLAPAFVQRACRLGETEVFQPGETVFAEGGQARRLGVLLTGRAQVHKAAGDARVLMSILEPGALLGAASMFLGEATTVTEVSAMKETQVLFFREDTLKALMRENFALAENYMGYLTSRIRFLTGRIESIGSPTAADKLMNYLALNATGGALTLPAGYGALAEALCLGRASLYRAMDALEGQGKIRREGKTIYLIQQEVSIT